ncbi:MAG: hypothetical protein IJ789_00970 [Bacteroidales bacterium]|nr:hypothetical protein [Bacteroidales bacterium]
MNKKNFDLNRFGKLVKHDLATLWPTFGPTMLIIVLLPMTIWLSVLVLGHHLNIESIPPVVRLMLICFSVVLVGIMAPSRIYRYANIRKDGIYFAMLPASKLEKFVSMLLMIMVVCPIVALIGGLLVDMFFTLLPFGPYRTSIWNMADSLHELFNFGDDYEAYYYFGRYLTPANVIVSSIGEYLANVALFLFTSTIFKRHKVLFTILALYAIEFVLTLIATPIIVTHFMELSTSGLVDTWVRNYDPDLILQNIYYWGHATNIIFFVGLTLWSGLRLKKMRY